jgi:radical SAM superfamily enzyme YgiQ (UPF0313 family)
VRVLFVFPDMSETTTNYTGVLNYGIASISAYLKMQDHEVGLLHITDPIDEATFKARVREEAPDIVAFSSTSHYAKRVREWSRWAHEARDVPVIVGGIHATLAPEDLARVPTIDHICIGEGEETMLDLVQRMESGGDTLHVEGLWSRDCDQVIRNPMRVITPNLDLMPVPDLSIFSFDELYSIRRGTFPFIMSRGCAFKCTYCCVSTLKNMFPREGAYWRFLTPARAVEVLRSMLDRLMPDAQHINFLDAIFFPNKKWLKEFGPLYREQIGLPFICNMRADMMTEEAAAIMADAGCEMVRMGVESGDERMTTEILKRHLKVEDIRNAFAILRRHDIRRMSYNMVGLPTETLPLALKTVRLNADIDPEEALAFIFYPYPGTDLHRLSAELGYLTDRELDHYRVGVTTNMPQFSETDILFVHRHFRALIRLYALGQRLPGALGRVWGDALSAALASPVFPRWAIVAGKESYLKARHRFGDWLVRRSPGLYRLLGGRDPVYEVRRVRDSATCPSGSPAPKPAR